MPRQTEIVVAVELEGEGYKCELALTRHQYDTARLSTVSNSKKKSQIENYQKMISIAVREKLVLEGRADKWVDFHKLKLEIIRKTGEKKSAQSSQPAQKSKAAKMSQPTGPAEQQTFLLD